MCGCSGRDSRDNVLAMSRGAHALASARAAGELGRVNIEFAGSQLRGRSLAESLKLQEHRSAPCRSSTIKMTLLGSVALLRVAERIGSMADPNRARLNRSSPSPAGDAARGTCENVPVSAGVMSHLAAPFSTPFSTSSASERRSSTRGERCRCVCGRTNDSTRPAPVFSASALTGRRRPRSTLQPSLVRRGESRRAEHPCLDVKEPRVHGLTRRLVAVLEVPRELADRGRVERSRIDVTVFDWVQLAPSQPLHPAELCRRGSRAGAA